MLKSLKIRIKNSLEKELKNASLEQNKITIIRIQKLMRSPITTHILELKNASLEQNKITIIRIQKLHHEKSNYNPHPRYSHGETKRLKFL